MKECGCKECVEKRETKDEALGLVYAVEAGLFLVGCGIAAGRGEAYGAAALGILGGAALLGSICYARMVGAKWGVEKL